MNARKHSSQPNEEDNLVKWMRRACQLELLKKTAEDETNPVKKDALYDLLGQEMCIA